MKLIFKQVFDIQPEEQAPQLYEVEMWDDGSIGICKLDQEGEHDINGGSLLNAEEVKIISAVFMKAGFIDVEEQKVLAESATCFFGSQE